MTKTRQHPTSRLANKRRDPQQWPTVALKPGTRVDSYPSDQHHRRTPLPYRGRGSTMTNRNRPLPVGFALRIPPSFPSRPRKPRVPQLI
ncbi:hypothetical protein NDU88_005425 [Pleurodeles waltl]|uniref:Uncharacterized protein n=1 Tax=Pleurodeles waltl TaxID=8319 RepID=A0AAV7LPH7_PLEWA|nr:hypothetical protein NDU88_005425 [Pleurodeles waltl]